MKALLPSTTTPGSVIDIAHTVLNLITPDVEIVTSPGPFHKIRKESG